MDNNLKLYLPFDQMEGGVTADFTPGRKDAVVTGDSVLTTDSAVRGSAIELRGGTVESPFDVPYGGDFSLACWIRPCCDKVGYVMNFSGVNNYLEQWLDVRRDEWLFLAFVKSGHDITVYKNTTVVAAYTMAVNPAGLSINEASLFESRSFLDEVRVYDKALSASEILNLQNQMEDVEYYIDGVNFKHYGVYVSSAQGIVGQLARKEGLSVDWDEYHGKAVDRSRPRFKERKIVLECFIEASSRTDYVSRVNSFFEVFRASGTQRLKIEYDGTTRPLVYEVYMKEEVDPDKKWGAYNSGLMVGTFKLVLEEDEPVKKVVRFTGSGNCKVSFTSAKLVNIYWGDGSHTYNLSGAVTQTHSYSTSGVYEIIITGVIEDIENFTTNGIVIWNKLQ